MTVTVLEGLPGSGKTTRLAKHALGLLRRNRNYFQETGKMRKVASNVIFADWVKKSYPNQIEYWQEPEDLQVLRDCDVVWDEMGVHLDATQWETLPQATRRWFQQHRKLGIDIVGTCQDFGQVDKSVRRVVENVGRCRKVCGSGAPSATRPEIKWIWGLVMLRWCAGREWRDDTQNGAVISWDLIPDFFMITRPLCSAFDTSQCIETSGVQKLRHIEAVCAVCGVKKCRHV